MVKTNSLDAYYDLDSNEESVTQRVSKLAEDNSESVMCNYLVKLLKYRYLGTDTGRYTHHTKRIYLYNDSISKLS